MGRALLAVAVISVVGLAALLYGVSPLLVLALAFPVFMLLGSR